MKDKEKRMIIIVISTSLFFISNWLMDIFKNFPESTNGFWDGLFGLNMIQSYHVAWYLSMIIYVFITCYSTIIMLKYNWWWKK